MLLVLVSFLTVFIFFFYAIGSDGKVTLWERAARSIFNMFSVPCQVLRCCHISPDSVNGRRTDRKSTKNVYPVVKVVSVAMKVVAECVRSA